MLTTNSVVTWLYCERRACFRKLKNWTKAVNWLHNSLIMLLPMNYGLYSCCNERRRRTSMQDDADCSHLSFYLIVQQQWVKVCKEETDHSTQEYEMRIVELRGITITILNKCTYQADTIDVYAYTEKNTITENRNEHVQPHQSLSKRRWRKRGIQPMKEKEYDILWVIEKVIKNRDNPPPARKNKQKARKECNVIPGRSVKGQIQLGMTMERGNNIEKR